MTRTRFLTDEWFEQLRVIAASSGGKSAGATRVGPTRLQAVIAGGPDGEVKCRAVFDGGELVSVDRGVADGPELTLTLSYDDAVAIQQAALDPSVAFMQGRLKSAGDPGLLLTLLAWAASTEWRALRERVDGVTEY